MIFIDDTAYKEFKELLDNANVDSYKDVYKRQLIITYNSKNSNDL